MTYVTVITLAAYGLLLVFLAAMAVIDARTRLIPNGLVIAMAALWIIWRAALGFAGRHTGIGFMAGLVSPAPDVPLLFGLSVTGVSLAGGLIGALVLGGGMLVITALFEATARKEAFGGGDIKLLAALGLFLGWERGLLCILVACMISLGYALVAALVRKIHERSQRKDATSSDTTFAGTTIPFGPFIALGTLLAFVA